MPYRSSLNYQGVPATPLSIASGCVGSYSTRRIVIILSSSQLIMFCLSMLYFPREENSARRIDPLFEQPLTGYFVRRVSGQ